MLRRLHRSFQKRGLLATLIQATKSVPKLISSSGSQNRPSEWDRQHGVETDIIVEAADLQIRSRSSLTANRYQASSVSAVMDAIQKLPISHRDYTFIDYGCGKGRVILLAAGFPFKRVIGIELSPLVASIARDNLTRYSGPLVSTSIEVIEDDVLTYTPPSAPIVCFFYNPFEQTILDKVLGRLYDAFIRNGHSTFIVFYDYLPSLPAAKYKSLFSSSSIEIYQLT